MLGRAGTAGIAHEETRELRVGAVLLCLVALAAAAVVYFTGHSLLPGIVFHVDWARIGNLGPGAKVRIAGREIGEVRDISLAPRAGSKSAPLLRAELWIRRSAAPSVRRNSELLVASDKVIGDRHVTVRPPRGDPGPPVESGSVLRGVDPPPLDEFLLRYANNLLITTRIIAENQDVISDLTQAAAQARATLAALDADGQHLPCIGRQLGSVGEQLSALRRTLEQATDGYRLPRRIEQQVESLGSSELARLDEIRDRVARLEGEMAAIGQLFAEPERRRLGATLGNLRQAAVSLASIQKAAAALLASVKAGDGTLGGLLTDRELFGDVKALRRLIIEMPWKVLGRPVGGVNTRPGGGGTP